MLTAVLTLLLGVIVTLAIIAACGFFVAQEFAYMSVDRSRLAARAEKGDVRRSASSRSRSERRSCCRVHSCITVTGLLIGYVAEPLIVASIGTLLGGVGIDPGVSVAIGTVGALLLATVVTMIFGELYRRTSRSRTPSPWPGVGGAHPHLPARLRLADHRLRRRRQRLLRLVRIEPLEDVDESATARDLEAIVEESRASGDLPDDLSMIIDRILDFPERDVEHAMVRAHRWIRSARTPRWAKSGR